MKLPFVMISLILLNISITVKKILEYCKIHIADDFIGKGVL